MDDKRSELADLLANALNTKFKSTNYKTAYFLEDDPDAPTNVNEWVPTGSSILDIKISNRPNGGFPVGRIIELLGLEASGKSLLAAHALANTQKKGGIAVYIETESSVSKDFLRAIGVDLKNLVYVPLDTIEDVFEAIESVIEKIRKTSRDVLVTIVVDSVAATTTKLEMSSDYDKAGYNTGKSIIISQALRKITNTIARERVCLIFTNQLRKNMSSMPGSDPYTTSGGMALAFHSSVRIRLRNMGKLKARVGGVEEIVGMKTRVVVTKNRVAPPWKEVVYDIYFNSGIDDHGGWLTIMKERKLVSQSGAWYEYTDKDSGEVIRFQSKDFESKVLSDESRKNIIYNDICNSLISKYRANEDGGIDDIKVDENIYEDDIDDIPTDSEDDEKPSAKIKPNVKQNK